MRALCCRGSSHSHNDILSHFPLSLYSYELFIGVLCVSLVLKNVNGTLCAKGYFFFKCLMGTMRQAPRAVIFINSLFHLHHSRVYNEPTLAC